MICFLCNSNNYKKIYSLSGGNIQKCQTCGMVIKKTTSQSMEELYGENYYDSYPYSNTLGLNDRYFTSKINTIIGKTSSKPTILDVGCGWGDFLEQCKKRSLPCFGIDQSPTAIKRLKEKKISAELIGIESFAKKHEKEFDAITSFQTIEHIKNPVLFLKSVQMLLKPGGIVLLTTPNNDSPLRFLMKGKWSVYNTESHITFFNKQTLHQTLEKACFADITVRFDPPRFFSPSYILSRLSYNLPSTIYNLLSKCPLPTDLFGDIEAICQ